MKTIFKLLMVSIVLFTIGCNEDDRILFDPDNLEDTILNLATESSESSATISLLPLETGVTLDIMLQSSTRFPNDRTFNVNIIEEDTNADPIYFDLPSSVTIAANEFVGIFTITAQDPLGEILSQNLVIEVTDGGDFTERFSIIIAIVAPFAGNYQVTVIQGATPFGGNIFDDGPIFIGFGTDVEGQPLERFMDEVLYLPAAGTFPFDLQYQIVDNGDGTGTVVVPLQNGGGGLGCGGGQPPLLMMASVEGDEAIVDLNDDSSYQLIFTDLINEDNSCAAPAYRVVVQLDRI